MEEEQQNFQTMCQAVYLVLKENHKSPFLPDWLSSFWGSESAVVNELMEQVQSVFTNSQHEPNLTTSETKLLQVLDQQRYFAAAHSQDEKLRAKIQDAMVTALFFSVKDVQAYKEFVLAEQTPEKFLNYLNLSDELQVYKEHLKKQQSVYGRLIKNLTDYEITLAAKGHMINGKLLEYFGLDGFLKHGFAYIKQELKHLAINNIEQGYLNKERINSYIEKIGFLLHPANELQQDKVGLVKNCRYLLEDIINTAGVQAGEPVNDIHANIINGCYWVDELFKSASSSLTAMTEI